MKILSDRIKELRIAQEITQKQLAKSVETTEDSIFSWEKGRAEPSAEFIARLAKVFEVSAGYLLGLED